MPGDVILVVDDEPQMRRVVRNALTPENARVIEAATGREAIDLAAAERPALIVLDLGLPDTQGIDVCREIRSWSDAPIIVLSARHSDQEKVALLDAGADDYLTKPFSPSELQARMRAQLRRSRLAPGQARSPGGRSAWRWWAGSSSRRSSRSTSRRWSTPTWTRSRSG